MELMVLYVRSCPGWLRLTWHQARNSEKSLGSTTILLLRQTRWMPSWRTVE
jgi:hypothetical protein